MSFSIQNNEPINIASGIEYTNDCVNKFQITTENQRADQISSEKLIDIKEALTSIDASKSQYLNFSNDQKEHFEVFKNDKFLNKRYIAHLFCDSFMQDSIYEGWFVTDALLHMITILQENEISPEVSKVLATLKGCLAWQERFIAFSIENERSKGEQIEEVNGEIDDVDINEIINPEVEESQLSPLEKVVEELVLAIENLEAGENIVMPGGFLGHSVLYEIKRVDDDFDFCVYNTGEGVEKHNLIIEDEGSEKAYGAYRLHNIHLEKITEASFLEDLINLKSDSVADFGAALYENILPKLEGKRSEVSADPSDYMLIQRSGTCTWKMFSAYLRYNLPLIQRKYIKLKARLDVFQKWYDLGNELDCVQVSQDLLERLVVNHKSEVFQKEAAPLNFSREELLTMGIYKVKKTFNKYKFLLNESEMEKADLWYKTFTGKSIYTA
ncbi:MAG: hypothetical protein S4CHLAM6_05400 [Chlamydiae bacterium]|nr:hypothetical protein [Chlamydiota bacterium]